MSRARAGGPVRAEGWPEVLGAFLRLGCGAFGGPVAHLGYFRTTFVGRRGWLPESDYAELVGLCQALPGPTSSQVAVGLGLRRAGPAGALAAFVGFTAPSALLMLALSVWVAAGGAGESAAVTGTLAGLKAATAAVVAQAVWAMQRSLAPDVERRAVAAAAALLVLALPTGASQIGALAAAGGYGALRLRPAQTVPGGAAPFGVSPGIGAACGAAFCVALIAAFAAPAVTRAPGPLQAAAMARAGALVFGGGHVVLPLLQAGVVEPGWVGADAFLAGYAAAQALPGPLFSVAAYLGAVSSAPPGGIAGGLLALVCIFAPPLLLLVAIAPLWTALQRLPRAAGARAGVNAAVVGLLSAALWDPVIKAGVRTGPEAVIAVTALGCLLRGVPPWLVVGTAALVGAALC